MRLKPIKFIALTNDSSHNRHNHSILQYSFKSPSQMIKYYENCFYDDYPIQPCSRFPGVKECLHFADNSAVDSGDTVTYIKFNLQSSIRKVILSIILVLCSMDHNDSVYRLYRCLASAPLWKSSTLESEGIHAHAEHSLVLETSSCGNGSDSPSYTSIPHASYATLQQCISYHRA